MGLEQILPDYYGAYIRGQEHGKQTNLERLGAQYFAQGQASPQLLSQIAGNGGNALAYQQADRSNRDDQVKQLAQFGRSFLSLPPEQQAAAYPQFAQMAQKVLNLPQVPPFDPAHVENIAKLIDTLDPQGPESFSNAGNGFMLGNRGTTRQIPGYADARPSRAHPIMVPDGRGGSVQMLFDPETRQVSPMDYGSGQPDPGSRAVQFDFAPGTSPEVQAATRAAAGVIDPGAAEVGGGVTQPPTRAQAFGGMGYKPPPAPKAPPGAKPAEAPLGDSSKHGDEYLATLPPEMRGLVKAIANGDSPAPSASSRAPHALALLQAVYQYDPSASSINLNARGATRKDFTSGKSAQNLRSLNQAIGHLGVLRSQISGVAGHSIPGIGTLVNKAENAYDRASGKPGITNYEQTAEALAGELTQVFRGNAGAEADIARNLEHLSAAQSVEQKNAAVKNIVSLLNSRIEELGQQYSQGMGKVTDPYSLLNKHAAEVLRSIAGQNKPSGPKVIRYDNKGNRIP